MICVIKELYVHHFFFFLLHTAQHHDLEWRNWGQVNWLRLSDTSPGLLVPRFFLPQGLKDPSSAAPHTQAQLCECSLLESSSFPLEQVEGCPGQTSTSYPGLCLNPPLTIWPSALNTIVKCVPFSCSLSEEQVIISISKVHVSTKCPLYPFRCCLLKAIIFYFLWLMCIRR